MPTDDLLSYLFDGQPHLLAAPMAEWLASSRRFAAFAAEFRSKIRKKLRRSQDPETARDLRLELETAYLLLRERALSLEYEPQQCGQPRCPDFAVAFTTSLHFMVEVTRLRAPQPTSPSADAAGAAPEVDRLVDTVCGKLGQLLAQRSNVLVVGADNLSLTPTELQAALVRLQQRAERSDPTLLQRHRFRNRAEFFGYYQRLSEIVVRATHLTAPLGVVRWSNAQARHPLPAKVRTALDRSHTL